MEMNETTTRLHQLLSSTEELLSQMPLSRLSHKPLPEKWSKKEILGHLIDSAINNLQRFTEIQYMPRPYAIRKYRQDELVVANHYQEAMVDELLMLWLALNRRIARVMDQQTEETLAYEILVDDQKRDLRFLMVDYVDHMAHHLNQIRS